jgi:ABC-type dipeptide/oligopeptide/nickel transport system permease component
MANYILRRLMQGVLVLVGVTIICFLMFQYLGDPVLALVGIDATQAQLKEAAKILGLDRPLYEQYVRFVRSAIHGDFGFSYVTRTPALKVVIERLPATLELSVTAMIFATLIGTVAGVISAVKPRAILSRLAMMGTLLGISLPTFLIGILSIYVFSIVLGWLPPFGRGNVLSIGFWSTGLLTASGWAHLILPALTLAFYQLSMSTRVMRGEMMGQLAEDYIRTARARGLSVVRVTLHHALKNALIPFVTISGLQLGQLIAFAIVTETVFQWPGMGKLLLMAINENDQPVIITYIMVIALIFVLINLTVDIVYTFLNPRIVYD